MGPENSIKGMPVAEYFHLLIEIQTCNISCKSVKNCFKIKKYNKVEVKMNPVEVIECLPDAYEVALILLQMSTGLRWSEFERKYAQEFRKADILRALARKCVEEAHLPAVKIEKPSPKRALATKENGGMLPTLAVKIEKQSPKKALATKENGGMLPPRKRGRPSKMVLQQPAKRAKLMAVEKEVIVPLRAASIYSSASNVTPKRQNPGKVIIKKEKNDDIAERMLMLQYSKATQMPASREIPKLSLFLMNSRSVRSFKSQVVQNVALNV